MVSPHVSETKPFSRFSLFLPVASLLRPSQFFRLHTPVTLTPLSEKSRVACAAFFTCFRDTIIYNTTHHPCGIHRLRTRSTRDVIAPPARPANVCSLPNSRRWQDFPALAEAHILHPQLWWSVCRSLEDGQDGTVACNRGGLDVLPGAETRHRAVGSSIMMLVMLGVEGTSLGWHDSLEVGFAFVTDRCGSAGCFWASQRKLTCFGHLVIAYVLLGMPGISSPK